MTARRGGGRLENCGGIDGSGTSACGGPEACDEAAAVWRSCNVCCHHVAHESSFVSCVSFCPLETSVASTSTLDGTSRGGSQGLSGGEVDAEAEEARGAWTEWRHSDSWAEGKGLVAAAVEDVARSELDWSGLSGSGSFGT